MNVIYSLVAASSPATKNKSTARMSALSSIKYICSCKDEFAKIPSQNWECH